MAWWSGRLNPRQKLFAELVHHHGMSPHKAYHEAGYSPSRWSPYRVAKAPGVQAYIRKLEERAMRKNDITVEKILTDLESARSLAMGEGQASAAVNATMAQAKVVGLIVERVERKDVSDMDMKELVGAVREVFGDQGEPLIKALGIEKPEPEPEKWPDFPPMGTVQ